MNEEKKYWELSFREQLDLARKGLPKSYDSKGKAYYLGPTPGQIISCWWGDHAGICNKIVELIKNGATNEDILKKYQLEYAELSNDQLEWLRNQLWIEAGREVTSVD